MLDDSDKEIIIATMWEMIREEVTKPLTNLIDCLLFELMATDSVDRERLEQRLSSAWENTSEDDRDTLGYKMFYRYLRTLQSMNDEPESWIELLQNARDNAESAAQLPEWFRGVIQGDRDDR